MNTNPPGPVENYNVSNLPYGDFSYLTDIISTHFNQSSQAYQNMVQMNPATASLISNAVSQLQAAASSTATSATNSNSTNSDTIKIPQAVAVAVAVASQNNKQAITQLASKDKEATPAETPEKSEPSPSTNNVTVNNVKDPIVINDTSKNDNTTDQNEESTPVVNNKDDQIFKVGDCQIVKITNVPNATAAESNNANINATSTPKTIGDCTVKTISNDD